jgi:hypothetical protein
MSRQCRGEAVPIQAYAYHRSPVEPLPAERTSHRRCCVSSVVAAWAQGSTVPLDRVIRKFCGTRSTYACSSASKCSRNSVQLP